MGRKKYALIWWINSSFKDVLELSTFPAKDRFVNAISTLTWVDHKTGKKTKQQAKILAVSEDKTLLDHMFVSDEGEILDHSTRVFSREVIEEKKNFDQKNKLKKNVMKSNKRQFQNALLNEASIVPNCQANIPIKKVRQFSMQQHDIPRFQGNFLQSTNFEPKKSLVHQGCSTSPIGTIMKQQVDQVHGAVSSPTDISEAVRSSFSEENTSTCGKVHTSKNDHDNNFSSSSEDEDVNKENLNGAIKAMAATFPGKITKRDIAFQELLLASMKYAYKSAHATENCSSTFEQEISPKCGFYLAQNVITYINTMAETDISVEQKDKWKIIVREVLLEVYGNTIANYVAKGKGGKKGGKPSINPLLLKGLLQWASQVSSNLVYKDFIYYINKFAANKRRYQQSKATEMRKLNSGKKMFHKEKRIVMGDESEEISSDTEERRVFGKNTENIGTGTNDESERGSKATGILEAAPFTHSEMGPRNFSAVSPSCQPYLQTGSSCGSWVPQHDSSYVPRKLQDSERIDWSQCLQEL